MGSIVPLTRRAPVIRTPRVRPVESESGEAVRAMHILLWTFALTALVMCATVVACFTDSWATFWWVSSFLLVFTLFKIGLAHALFYVMVRYDVDREAERAAALEQARAKPLFRRPVLRPHRVLRVAASSGKTPRPRAPR
jgi:hypothetical protein